MNLTEDGYEDFFVNNPGVKEMHLHIKGYMFWVENY
jgi:hypothetical protein